MKAFRPIHVDLGRVVEIELLTIMVRSYTFYSLFNLRLSKDYGLLCLLFFIRIELYNKD